MNLRETHESITHGNGIMLCFHNSRFEQFLVVLYVRAVAQRLLDRVQHTSHGAYMESQGPNHVC